MAPAYAVPRMLARAALQDFDFYEIHEAFAAQVLCTFTRGRMTSIVARDLASRVRSAPSIIRN